MSLVCGYLKLFLRGSLTASPTMADIQISVSAFMPHPFRRNELIHAFWKEEITQGRGGAGAPPPPGPGFIPCLAASTVTTVGPDGTAPTASAAAAEAGSRRGSRNWGSSSDEDDYYSSKRVPAPWISCSSPPPPPPDVRVPATPLVSLPPGIQSPPASDLAAL